MVSVAAQWSGMFQIEVAEDGAQRFWRLDPSGFLPPFTDLLANRAAMAAGVRAGWRSDGGTLTIAGNGSADCAPYDILVNGQRSHRLPAVGAHSHTIELGSLEPGSLVQLWLPHFGDFTLAHAVFDGENVTAAVRGRPALADIWQLHHALPAS